MSGQSDGNGPDKYQKAADHLAYEVRMFFGTAREVERRTRRKGNSSGVPCVSTGGYPPELERESHVGVGDDVLWDALVESFLIHFRALVDFLFLRPSNDDVAAKHYVPSGADMHTCVPPSLRRLKRRVHKEVAHLTYARTLRSEPEDREWPFLDIARKLGEELRDFLGLGDSTRLGSARDKIEKVLEEFGQP